MFIPEEEVQKRLRTEENLINRISRGEEISSLPLSQIVPPALPLDMGIDITKLLNDGEESEKPKNSARDVDFESVDARKARKALDRLLDPSSYPGRGTKDLSRDTQAAIGVTASILGTTKASRLGDVAISQAHSYERGYTDPSSLVDPAKNPKEELREKIIQGHGIVVDKCFNRLLKTLDLLDDGKLESVKRATDLSVIAKNLSGVVQHATNATQDKGIEVNDNKVSFIIMKPERALESEYPTIEVNSKTTEEAYKEAHPGE